MANTKKTDKKSAKQKVSEENIVNSLVQSNAGGFSDDTIEDADDLTTSFAKLKASSNEDAWDVVSTDEDDIHPVTKDVVGNLSSEDELDAVIADYAGIDNLAPEKSNKED